MRYNVPMQLSIGLVQKNLWQKGVLPIMALGALSSLLGVYWDIAWHIDIGRDTFFTMPHNFIYSGMLLVLITTAWGLFSDTRATPFSWRIAGRNFHPGMLIAMVSAALILFFAPADELWHQYFGVDATLWGPMHLVGLTGFTFFTLSGMTMAWLEREIAPLEQKVLFERLTLFFAAALLGNLMLFLAEYEFNIAQFPIDFHPLLLAALGVFPLVLVAKIYPRAWAATKVVLMFTALRLVMHLWLSTTSGMELAGDSKPVFPILLLTALFIDVSVKHLPTWLLGVCAGIVTLVVGFVVNQLFPQMLWTMPVLLRGGVAGVLLAGLAALLAARVGRILEPRA
jgi:hypothetical protein